MTSPGAARLPVATGSFVVFQWGLIPRRGFSTEKLVERGTARTGSVAVLWGFFNGSIPGRRPCRCLFLIGLECVVL